MKVGDTVECIDSGGNTRLKLGRQYKVAEVLMNRSREPKEMCRLEGQSIFKFFTRRFKVVGTIADKQALLLLC